MAGISDSDAKDEALSDTITAVVQEYFKGKIKRFVRELTESWSRDKDGGIDEDGKRDAFEILSRVTSYSYEEYEKYLNERYSSDTSDEVVAKSLDEAKAKLLVLSKCVNGQDDEIFRQCDRLTDEEEGALRSRIGNFLKTKMNKFIKKQFSDLLEDCVSDEASAMSATAVIANDRRAGGGGSGGVSGLKAMRLVDGDKKEIER